MIKRVYEDDLNKLLVDCFVKAYSNNAWFDKTRIEISINSIYAKISYNFSAQQSLKNNGFENFKKLLEKYCGKNLIPSMLDDEILIQVEYEVILNG